jgi:hypothetical protein
VDYQKIANHSYQIHNYVLTKERILEIASVISTELQLFAESSDMAFEAEGGRIINLNFDTSSSKYKCLSLIPLIVLECTTNILKLGTKENTSHLSDMYQKKELITQWS